MMWIYDLPNVVVGTIMVAVVTGVALCGFFAWKYLIPWQHDSETSGTAIAMLGVVAMLISLLLAFSAVSVWEAYGGADTASAEEASISGELVRDLAVYGPPAKKAREAVRDYLKSVITEEWPAMSKGSNAETTSHKFNMIFHQIAQIEPITKREEILLAEIWQKTNQLNEYRRGRLNIAGGSAVPKALWGTIVVGLVLNFVLFYLLPNNKFHRLLLAVYAATLGLMIFFIIVMDRPFTGSVSISPYAYEEALKSMQRWDSETNEYGK